MDQNLILERYFGSAAKRSENPCQGSEYEKELMPFNDEYYCLQWYLVSDLCRSCLSDTSVTVLLHGSMQLFDVKYV